MADTRWFEQGPKDLQPNPKKREVKDLWVRCPGCADVLYKPALAERDGVCLHCGQHFRLGARDRLALLVDPGSFTEADAKLSPTDALGFVDSKSYPKRIDIAQKKTGEVDAFISGPASIHGIDLEIGAFNFFFMGGSMGSVVGERITRLFERATERKVPAVVISSSGGARMQEGILSLMQMAKTCAALARLRDDANMPYISVLADPTTGGVAASFAMLGDVIVAEPKAMIGFAGARVIEQTIGEVLPEGFQTSEYLLDHGMIDRIIPRHELRDELAHMLCWMLGRPDPSASPAE
jgi:acetyl-CoA carboxylase carboxyl transferase subunit beta